MKLALLLVVALAAGDGTVAADPPASEPSTSAPEAVSLGRVRSVPNEQRAPVPYELLNGVIVFMANIAGRDVWALLDTGSDSSMVDLEFARSAGLSIGAEENSAQSLHGQFKTRPVAEVPILIPGQFETRLPRLPGSDMRALLKMTGRKVEFVLGADFLRPVALLINPRRKTFMLMPSGGFRPPPDAVEIGLQDRKRPLIEITIGNEKAIVKIDTGANPALGLPSAVWTKVVPKGAPIGTGMSTGAEGMTYVQNSARLRELEIGSLKLKDVVVHELPGPRTHGLLGMRILGSYRIALDMKAGKLWLGPLEPPGNEPRAESSEGPDAAAP